MKIFLSFLLPLSFLLGFGLSYLIFTAPHPTTDHKKPQAKSSTASKQNLLLTGEEFENVSGTKFMGWK